MPDLAFLFPLFVLAALLFSALRIFREYERGVIFRLGRFNRVGGPGLTIVIPLIEQVAKVDLRVITLDVPTQDVISRDNVSVKVNAVVYFRVVDADIILDQPDATGAWPSDHYGVWVRLMYSEVPRR